MFGEENFKDLGKVVNLGMGWWWKKRKPKKARPPKVEDLPDVEYVPIICDGKLIWWAKVNTSKGTIRHGM